QKDTLLIVDDTQENIGVLFDFLMSHGFKILVAENGEDALENAFRRGTKTTTFCRRNLSISQRFSSDKTQKLFKTIHVENN
ncbi:hypothetical protein QUF82_19110, partial [Thiotrichales bacterium HSG14]|nr:hypothetical protein [Thiotrichales bacterium HSG14]